MIDQFDSLALHIPVEYDTRHKNALTKRFKDSLYFRPVDLEKWHELRVDSNYVSISISKNSASLIETSIDIHTGTLYYAELWNAKYMWLLFGWIQVDFLLEGQS